MTIEERVRHVCSLQQGWLDATGAGESVDVSPDVVLRIIRALTAAGFEEPAVVPTYDGWVELEFPDGLNLEIRD